MTATKLPEFVEEALRDYSEALLNDLFAQENRASDDGLRDRTARALEQASARRARTILRAMKLERAEGVREGLTLFAWWKDGAQWVGTCGTPLKEAIAKYAPEAAALEKP